MSLQHLSTYLKWLSNGQNLAVLVEQTLATHKERGDLMDVIERRIASKSSKGQNYAANKHLIVLCNKPGDLREAEIARMVAASRFGIVNVIAFQADSRGHHFLSFIFDSDYDEAAIYRCLIMESKLWEKVIEVYEQE